VDGYDFSAPNDQALRIGVVISLAMVRGSFQRCRID
jgi:hypothetical protein